MPDFRAVWGGRWEQLPASAHSYRSRASPTQVVVGWLADGSSVLAYTRGCPVLASSWVGRSLGLLRPRYPSADGVGPATGRRQPLLSLTPKCSTGQRPADRFRTIHPRSLRHGPTRVGVADLRLAHHTHNPGPLADPIWSSSSVAAPCSIKRDLVERPVGITSGTTKPQPVGSAVT